MLRAAQVEGRFLLALSCPQADTLPETNSILEFVEILSINKQLHFILEPLRNLRNGKKNI